MTAGAKQAGRGQAAAQAAWGPSDSLVGGRGRAFLGFPFRAEPCQLRDGAPGRHIAAGRESELEGGILSSVKVRALGSQKVRPEDKGVSLGTWSRCCGGRGVMAGAGGTCPTVRGTPGEEAAWDASGPSEHLTSLVPV